MNYKACIFDFDGTLVDSMPYWAEKMLRILRKTNTPIPDGLVKHIATLGDAGTAKYFRDELGVPMSIEDMYAMMDAYALPKYRDEIIFKEGVRAYLDHLCSKGVTICVLTASPHKMLDPCLTRLGVFDWFSHVWTTEDFGMTKAEPAIYQEAARRLGLDVSDCLFFDDNSGAVKTASVAGMPTVGVFDLTGEDYLDAMKATATYYVDSFAHMPEELL